jgi:RNA polymerase sigma-70 factor (ECF subfamily)
MTAVQEETQLDLAALIKEHQSDLWRYVRYLGATGVEAEDLVQDAFLAVARRPFEQRDRASSAAYLRTVIRRQLLMLRRKQRREIDTTELEAAESVWANMTDGSDSNHLLAALSRCLDHLTPRASEALRLFYTEGQSREVVATRLEMKVDGIKTLLRRTRDRLRACIERKADRD